MTVSQTDPFFLTIFGASGDLAKIMLFPALYVLAEQGRLPKQFHIVGFARTQKTRAVFHKEFTAAVRRHHLGRVNRKVLKSLLAHVEYFSGQYTDKKDFLAYRTFREGLTKNKRMTHIAYFSVPPTMFRDIIGNLAATRRAKRDDIRLVIEKPFGEDKKSAEALFHFASTHFKEDQFYLLDHYLGKTSVRSMLNMRHHNRVLNTMMRGREIANIQITAFENAGVEHRIGYFEQVGIVRDMIQSHLLQILSMVTMAIPIHRTAENMQQEKLSILNAITCPCDADNVVLGQYKGYCKQANTPNRSRVDTFAAVRLFLDREDWYNVPIYIRTGKKLHEKHTYVVVEFKKFPFQAPDEEPNRLMFEFHPYERVTIALLNKQEDIAQYQEIRTSDSFACDIRGCLPEHGTLLLDVIRGEKMHFLSFAEILAAWAVVDKIEALMTRRKISLYKYDDGSTGPKQQHKLTDADGFCWYDMHPDQ